MSELGKPRVYGDRIMPLLAKVDKELQIMEIEFIMDEVLAHRETDATNYARIQLRLREIYEDLQLDRIRGDSAIDRLRTQVFEPFQDLTDRLVESKKFPEFWELYEFMQINQ